MASARFAIKDVVAWARRAAPSATRSGLRISEPDDTYEQEADHVADEVMSGGAQRRHWSLLGSGTSLRRKCSCGGSRESGGECEACKHNKEEQTLQRKAAATTNIAEAPPIVGEVLNSPGRPLDPATRDYFEPRFGYDLSGVRIHTDGRAAASAQSISALAYTVGNDIVFDQSRYAPHSTHGHGLLAHELTHVVQQRHGGPKPVIRRAPGPPPVKPSFQITAADLDYIEGVMSQLAAKLNPSTLKTLTTDKTLVIGLVQDADGDLALVYTVSGDWINKSLKDAAESLDITRWDVGEGRRPRGAKGAPGDAEQRMIEFAGEEFQVKGMVVSRKVCPDCVEAIAEYEHGPIAVREGKLKPPAAPPPPAAGGSAAGSSGKVTALPQPAPKTGGAPVEGGEIPKTTSGPHAPTTVKGAGGEPGVIEGEVPAVPKSVEAPKPPAGEVKPPKTEIKPPTSETPGAAGLVEGKPSGIGTVSAEAGVAAAEFSLSGAILGFVVEQAIFAAVVMALQWALAKAFEAELEADIENILKPAIAAKLKQLEPKLKTLAGTRKLMVRITYDFIYQRDSPDDPVGSFMQGAPPFYELGSMRLINVHPGNEELDFPSSSSERRERLLGPRERVTARSSYSVLLDDAPRRLREKQMAAIVEKHRVKQSAPPQKAGPPPPAAPSAPPLLPSPAPQQAPSEFTPLPGAPGPSPLQDIDKKVATARNRCLSLIAYGDRLQSSSPSNGDITKFVKAESDWRDAVTYSLLYYKNNGPDYGRSKYDELLNSDQYGGRLMRIRQTFGR